MYIYAYIYTLMGGWVGACVRMLYVSVRVCMWLFVCVGGCVCCVRVCVWVGGYMCG